MSIIWPQSWWTKTIRKSRIDSADTQESASETSELKEQSLWASRKVVLLPEGLEVVEALPFSSLSVAVLPASDDAGSAKARTGNRRARISFMRALDDVRMERFTWSFKIEHQSIAIPTISRTPTAR